MTRTRPCVELVAPAGGWDTLEAALEHGADAVYIGVGPHNLRARAPCFEVDEVHEAVRAAHARAKRLFCTFNTMPAESDLAQIESCLKSLALQPEHPDALIIADTGVLRMCRRILGDVPLHLSTQAGAFNSESMAFWAQQGIRRIVLPRELTLSEIATVSAQHDCETEVFVHGAMCVSVSGRCLLGAYLAGRHPNRGDCPQPCRLRYRISLNDPDRPQWGGSVDADESDDGVYLLNAKDLNALSLLPDIIASGVSAIKIEGRNKSVHYVSAVVKTYRAALDTALRDPALFTVLPEWNAELERIDHRPYTTGFYAGEYIMQHVGQAKAVSRVRMVGVVRGHMEDGQAAVEVKNPFAAGELLNVLPVRQGAAAFDSVWRVSKI